MTRRFASTRPVRLSDTDATGRLRLDAVARYLQDVASDDWEDAGFGSSDSAWVVRRTELEVVVPFAEDERVELETWCSGVAGSAAARRYSLTGDRPGPIEAESIWIHLDLTLRPKRLDARFLEIYGAAAEGRRTPTRFTLPAPDELIGSPWHFRTTDVDRLGHVNNAAYWIPLEQTWLGRLAGPLKATLEYRKPIDLGEPVELVHEGAGLWLVVDGDVRAAAILDAQ